MKLRIIILALLTIFNGCSDKNNDNQNINKEINDLKQKSDNTYKPGLGEFMSNIQLHHAKLWFAGKNQNWKLADYEINEMQESFDDIQKYATERIESKQVSIIKAPIDNIKAAISKKDINQFTSSFQTLTNTCNKCHHANKFEFNVIIIPKNLPVVNQEFRVLSKK